MVTYYTNIPEWPGFAHTCNWSFACLIGNSFYFK